MKATLTPGGLFEEFGLRYIGPIDGHDIKNLIRTINLISKINSPILLHVYTNKNKYIQQDNDDDIKFFNCSFWCTSNSIIQIFFIYLIRKVTFNYI